ncbi:hypothetical protein [Streptomyces sp. NPDC047525]|uniref:hypothetical protein n=1 Tax=Streptomyces sp. NPDC047525 TaxID=3155264 RepID=UPI0033F10ABA
MAEVWVSVYKMGGVWRELIRAEDVRGVWISEKRSTLNATVVGRENPVSLFKVRSPPDSEPTELTEHFDIEFVEAVGTARQRPEGALIVLCRFHDGHRTWQAMTSKEYAAWTNEIRANLASRHAV